MLFGFRKDYISICQTEIILDFKICIKFHTILNFLSEYSLTYWLFICLIFILMDKLINFKAFACHKIVKKCIFNWMNSQIDILNFVNWILSRFCIDFSKLTFILNLRFYRLNVINQYYSKLVRFWLNAVIRCEDLIPFYNFIIQFFNSYLNKSLRTDLTAIILNHQLIQSFLLFIP